MGRRDQEGLPLEIELLDGVGADEQEVHFGGRRVRAGASAARAGSAATGGAASDAEPGRPSRAPLWTVLGVLAGVGALIAVGATVGGGSDSSPTRSTVPRTTEPATTAPPSTTLLPSIATLVTTPETEPPTLTPIVERTYPPFVPRRAPEQTGTDTAPTVVPTPGTPAFDPGWTLYLWDTTRGPTALVGYDFATGTVWDVPLGEAPGPIKAVLPTSAGPVVDAGELVFVGADGPQPVGWGDDGIADFTQTGPRVATGPDGLIWVRTLNPASLALFDPATGRNFGRYVLPLGTELIGTTEDGDPVVRGADLTSYQILDDGSSVQYAEGITTPIEGGRYAEVRCTPTTECIVSLHAGFLGVSYSLGETADLERTAVRFSPDGTHVAVGLDGAVRILQPLASAAVEVPFAHVSTGDPVSRPAINYFRLARDLVWTPDSDALGLLTDHGIAFVDTDGGDLGTVLIDPANPLRYVPLAIG